MVFKKAIHAPPVCDKYGRTLFSRKVSERVERYGRSRGFGTMPVVPPVFSLIERESLSPKALR